MRRTQNYRIVARVSEKDSNTQFENSFRDVFTMGEVLFLKRRFSSALGPIEEEKENNNVVIFTDFGKGKSLFRPS